MFIFTVSIIMIVLFHLFIFTVSIRSEPSRPSIVTPSGVILGSVLEVTQTAGSKSIQQIIKTAISPLKKVWLLFTILLFCDVLFTTYYFTTYYFTRDRNQYNKSYKRQYIPSEKGVITTYYFTTYYFTTYYFTTYSFTRGRNQYNKS